MPASLHVASTDRLHLRTSAGTLARVCLLPSNGVRRFLLQPDGMATEFILLARKGPNRAQQLPRTSSPPRTAWTRLLRQPSRQRSIPLYVFRSRATGVPETLRPSTPQDQRRSLRHSQSLANALAQVQLLLSQDVSLLASATQTLFMWLT